MHDNDMQLEKNQTKKMQAEFLTKVIQPGILQQARNKAHLSTNPVQLRYGNRCLHFLEKMPRDGEGCCIVCIALVARHAIPFLVLW